MYAIVACPACGTHRVVEARHEATRCTGCGRTVETARSTRFMAATAEEARRTLQDATTPEKDDLDTKLEASDRADRDAAEPVRIDVDPVARAVAAGTKVSGQQQRAEAAAEALSQHGPFPEPDFVDAMEQLGIPRPTARDLLVALLAKNRIYEPRPGHYAWL